MKSVLHADRFALTLALLAVPMLMHGMPVVEGQTAASSTPVPGVFGPSPATSPRSPDSFVMGSRTFNIPYSVEVGGKQPVEVQLFVARGPFDPDQADRGWRLIEAKQPDQISSRQFLFTADQDGEYWFATRTTQTAGASSLASSVDAQLKVFVDTTKPTIELTADADGYGNVQAQMQILDQTPVNSVTLRYVTDAVSTWQNVDLSVNPVDGLIRFTPSLPWQQISIQVIASDAAGNQSVVNERLRRPRIALAPDDRYAMLPPGDTYGSGSPYRIPDGRSTRARTSSGPVIALDRPRDRPPSNHANALGYAPASPRFGNPGRSVRPSEVGQLPGQPSQPSQPGQPGQPGLARGAPSGGLGVFRGAAYPQQDGVLPAPASGAPTSQAPTGQAPAGRAPELIPPPEPTSMLDRVFGRPPGPAASGPPLDAPSIYANPNPNPNPNPGAGPTVGELPPPATPEQITNGFGLTPPQQASPADSSTGIAGVGMPETIPTPQGEQEVSSSPPSGPKPLPERTLAESIRPLAEESAVPRSEQLVAPDPQLERYRVSRQSESQSPAMAARAPIRYSDSERFSLAYELEAVGSQGVEAIELYGSLDEGRTWKLWGRDPDRTSPFDIETREEGVFAYRIVVVGNNGLNSPRPIGGEAPDIVVVVDKQSPQVRLSGARYGEGDRIGALVIQYECSDANLLARPITLAFSDTVDGPWTTIAAGLRNDGTYVWPADPKLPRQFFLRVDATDQAGNVGTSILDQPIDAQGLAPRARIRGFQSISETPPAAAFK